MHRSAVRERLSFSWHSQPRVSLSAKLFHRVGERKKEMSGTGVNGRKEEEGRGKEEGSKGERERERYESGEIACRRREKTRGALSRSATSIVTSLNSTHTIFLMYVTYFCPPPSFFLFVCFHTRGGIQHRMTFT